MKPVGFYISPSFGRYRCLSLRPAQSRTSHIGFRNKKKSLKDEHLRPSWVSTITDVQNGAVYRYNFFIPSKCRFTRHRRSTDDIDTTSNTFVWTNTLQKKFPFYMFEFQRMLCMYIFLILLSAVQWFQLESDCVRFHCIK